LLHPSSGRWWVSRGGRNCFLWFPYPRQ
jgi:hypothetical protein